MFRKIANAVIRPGLVSLMLAVPVGGAIAFTPVAAEAGSSFKVKKFKKHHSFKHSKFKGKKFAKSKGYYKYGGHSPSVAFKFKKFKKFH
ncbi:MAG: hypothetical protein AAGF53_02950 [Pseudomonadota bacterium]